MLVGSLMLINVVKIKWGNINEAVPAFLTIIIMPMTYSIAYGVHQLRTKFSSSLQRLLHMAASYSLKPIKAAQ